jgi:hypothetical protein
MVPLAVFTTTIAPDDSQPGRIDRRARLPHDGARGLLTGESRDLGLHGIDNLALQATVEAIEVPRPPASDDGIGDELEHAAPKGTVSQERRHLQDGVLTSAADETFGADRLIRLEQGEQCVAEGVLHPRAPELVELAPEDRQRIRDGLVAGPPQAHVEQVQAEGAAFLGYVEIDDVGTSPRRHQAEHGVGEVAVRVDDDERRRTTIVGNGLHEVARDAEQERRLPATGLGDQQQMTAEQLVGQRDRHGSTLVGRDADAAAVSHREWPGHASPSAGPLEQRDIGLGLRQMPETGQLAGVQDRRRSGRGQRSKRAQVERILADAPRRQTVAGGQVELAIRSRQPVQALAHRRGRGVGRREDGQPNLGPIGDAADLLLNQAHIVDGSPRESSHEQERRHDPHADAADQERQLQPLARAVPLVPLVGQTAGNQQCRPHEDRGE